MTWIHNLFKEYFGKYNPVCPKKNLNGRFLGHSVKGCVPVQRAWPAMKGINSILKKKN